MSVHLSQGSTLGYGPAPRVRGAFACSDLPNKASSPATVRGVLFLATGEAHGTRDRDGIATTLVAGDVASPCPRLLPWAIELCPACAGRRNVPEGEARATPIEVRARVRCPTEARPTVFCNRFLPRGKLLPGR